MKRLLVGNSLLGCEDVNEKLKIKLVANDDNKISPRLNKLFRISNVANKFSGDLRTSKTRFEEMDLSSLSSTF